MHDLTEPAPVFVTQDTGSYLDQELRRRQEARRAADLADGFDEPDSLILPLALALARLAAQRDARRRHHP